MRKLIDLTGQRFGRFLVQERGPNITESDGTSRVRWWCLCDCGNQVLVRASSLKAGTSQSCGCLHREKMAEHWKLKRGLPVERSNG